MEFVGFSLRSFFLIAAPQKRKVAFFSSLTGNQFTRVTISTVDKQVHKWREVEGIAGTKTKRIFIQDFFPEDFKYYSSLAFSLFL